MGAGDSFNQLVRLWVMAARMTGVKTCSKRLPLSKYIKGG